MKIAIMGSGGVGGYYGGLLAQQAHDVVFIARGEHLEAIRKHGLQVKSVFGDFVVRPARATDRPAGLGKVDLILVCTKTYDTEEASRALLPMVGRETTVLSLQNGVDAADRIGEVAGRKQMIAGTTWISSAVERPGVIRQVSAFRRVVAGEPSGGITVRVKRVVAALKQAGVTAEASDNIQGVLWQKFIFIAAAAGFGALTRLPIGAYRSVPRTRSRIVELMEEADLVARAMGVKLGPDAVEQALLFMDSAGADLKASMQLDEETGRPTEIESMIGVIGREGRRLGVPTPTADIIYDMLQPVELHAHRN